MTTILVTSRGSVSFLFTVPGRLRAAAAAAAAAKSLQSCPTLCTPIDGSPPGSPVPGILQARTLEWVAISFSKAQGRWAKRDWHAHTTLYTKKVKVKVVTSQLCPTVWNPWTIAHQAPMAMGFSSQEYWSGWPFTSPGDLPDSGIKLGSPTL